MSTTPEQLRIAADILEKGLEWEVCIGGAWNENFVKLSLIRWIDDGYEIRIKPQPDPYAELKAALAAGKVIQVQWTMDIGTDRWYDVDPDWTMPIKQYRIKPEPKEQTIQRFKSRFAMACATLGSLGWHEGEDGAWKKVEPPPAKTKWPLTPDDVPAGCEFRHTNTRHRRYLPVIITDKNVTFLDFGDPLFSTPNSTPNIEVVWDTLADQWQMRRSGDADWRPCWVEE